jgi:ribulose-5-phosphate 4-epimerase/fuculose-1-phosphate aldolase
MDAALKNATHELVLANRAMAAEGVIDDFGHVSTRHPLDQNCFLLSRSNSPINVTIDDIMEFTIDGDPVAQNGRRIFAERYIHAAIYKVRPEVNCVIHHHAKSVLPFTITDIPLRPLFHMAAVIGPEVPSWDSQNEFGDTNMLVDSMDMGKSLAATLGNHTCALLRRHGAVCVEETIAGACLVAVYLKENADLMRQALALSSNLSGLTQGEIRKSRAMQLTELPLERAWKYWKTKAGFRGI